MPPMSTTNAAEPFAAPSMREQLAFWLPFVASAALALAAILFDLRSPSADAPTLAVISHFAAMTLLLAVGCGLAITAIRRNFAPYSLWLGIAALVANSVALVLTLV